MLTIKFEIQWQKGQGTTDNLNRYCKSSHKYLSLIRRSLKKSMSFHAEEEYQVRNPQQSYQKITLQARKQLITMVLQQGFSVYRACRLLNINNSTAKAIIRKFRAQEINSDRELHAEDFIPVSDQSHSQQGPFQTIVAPRIVCPQQILPMSSLDAGMMFYICIPAVFMPYC